MSPTTKIDRDALSSKARFRDRARDLVQNARSLLELDDVSLDIVALRLRKAFECLAYERAVVYLDELRDRDLAIWQPLKLMNRLIELDRLADLSLEMSIQNPETGEWVSLGQQNGLSIRDIKANYGRLSRVIHDISLRQLVDDSGTNDIDARDACYSSLAVLEKVLSSTLWNVALPSGGFVNFGCVACEAKIHRRLTALVDGPHKKADHVEADCPTCAASYEISLDEDGSALWREHRITATCPNPKCCHEFDIWPRSLIEGKKINCHRCSK